MKAIVIGNLTIDKNIINGKIYEGPGGTAYFVSQTLNNFKLPNLVISPYGSDFPKKYLKNISVYPSYPVYPKNLVFHNFLNGKKRIQKVDNPNYIDNLPVQKLPKEIFSGVNILIIATVLNNISADYIRELKNCLKPDCLCVLIAQGLLRSVEKDGYVEKIKNDKISEYLPLVDYVFISDKDTINPFKRAKIWASLGPTIIVTQEEKGCTLFNKNSTKSFPSFKPQKIIDSTGAGDIFSAAFSYAKIKGKGDTYCTRFANATASLSLSCSKNNLYFTESDVRKVIGY